MSRVSIVIPCFNMGDYLAEAVESALDQTHGDVEVVVVDDGSTDPATRGLLEALPWPQVQLVRQSNAGLPSARNAGIAVATGDYILPLDADDRIEATYAAEAAAVLDANPEVGIVYCRAHLFGAVDHEWALPEFSLPTMLTQNLIFAAAMYRRADWETVGGYDPALRAREDHDFWLKLLGLGRQVFRLDEVLFHYRVRPDSMNSTLDRETLTDSYTRIFTNNAALYVREARALVTHYLDRHDELMDWRHRYGRLERVIDHFPRAYGLLRRSYRQIRRRR